MSRSRSNPVHLVRYAVRHPDRIGPHLRRTARDVRLLVTTRGDHVRYYREVMRSDAAKDPSGAIGSHTQGSWLRMGKLQFDYLRHHGLLPSHRLLEIGCGNLRAGWRFIDYLEPGGYYGIDISPDILFAAQDTLSNRGLQAKLPHLTPVRDLSFSFLPAAAFDVVHAHSVFSHCPAGVIDECLANVERVLRPGGFLDFTFNQTTGREHQVLREDFYYRTDTLVAMARRHGLAAELLEDWESLPHKQSKLRVWPLGEQPFNAEAQASGEGTRPGGLRRR